MSVSFQIKQLRYPSSAAKNHPPLAEAVIHILKQIFKKTPLFRYPFERLLSARRSHYTFFKTNKKRLRYSSSATRNDYPLPELLSPKPETKRACRPTLRGSNNGKLSGAAPRPLKRFVVKIPRLKTSAMENSTSLERASKAILTNFSGESIIHCQHIPSTGKNPIH